MAIHERPAPGRPPERIQDPFEDYMLELQGRSNNLLQVVVEGASEEFREPYEHALGGTPKRIRPVLAYATADTLGLPREAVDGFGTAVELFHTASLALDDLPAQDNSDRRRGKEALHIKYRESTAQLTAFAMVFDAQSLLVEADASRNLGGRLVKYVNGALGKHGMTRGQVKDLAIQESGPQADCTVEKLDEISHLKTGMAIEMSVVGVGIIGGLPDDTLRVLQEYSYHAGIAFQVKDDLLDGHDTSVTGKSSGGDAKNGKPTYVSVLGTEVAAAKLTFHVEEAKKIIDRLPPDINPWRYKELVDYIASRER